MTDYTSIQNFSSVSTELLIKCSCFSLLCYYVRSLVNKLSKFQELVSESNELWDHWYVSLETWRENRIIMTCFPYQITMNHIKNIEKKAGGVLFYIGDSIQYQNRPDILMAQNFIENIFIEI